jgi:hypothetical protein
MRKIKEEETRSDEDSSSRVIMLESFDFKYVWSFNHPCLSMKEHQDKLR